MHSHVTVPRQREILNWEEPRSGLAINALPQLVSAVGKDIILTLTSARNWKRKRLWFLSSHVRKGINLSDPKDF